MTLADIRADFALLDDWEDRYRFIIELGRELPPLPSELKTEANKVRGCVSQVWLVSEVVDRDAGRCSPILKFRGDSDAHIVRGLIALLFALYQGKSAQDILAIDPAADFAALGLKEHLTPQRSNGLASMVERIRSQARGALAREARVG
ncbi:MAG TPA: SufE family protein [Hyphomicrobiaceae bacterium]|nr:SufE family protein [Hyphomicrobiaceae bacterium]